MRTVTFYSYKGGVGRTLALANVARYLAQFGQKVFALDLDLEAPGLHYKLLPQRRVEIERGFVDYLHAYLHELPLGGDLRSHVIVVEEHRESGGRIDLMPAGRVPSTEYWQLLAQVSWHDLFYSANPVGVPFFLELKGRIEQQFSPDFLLIDARTGITEIGGVASTVLPDTLVCLLVNNPENLEGARAVLRSLRSAPRLVGSSSVEVVPVIARIPDDAKPDAERDLLESIRAFFQEPAESIADTLKLDGIFVLHSEQVLQWQEHLKFGGAPPEDTPLVRDYLRLFQRLIPAAVITDRVGPILKELADKAFEDPAAVQRDMETLANVAPHSEVLRALLKFYRLRNATPQVMLKTAERIWRNGGAIDELVQEIAANAFLSLSRALGTLGELPRMIDLTFIQTVWEYDNGADVTLGLALAQAWQGRGSKGEAARIYERLAQHKDMATDVRTQVTLGMAGTGEWERVLRDLSEDAVLTAFEPVQLERLADAIIATGDGRLATRFLQAIGPRVEMVRRRDFGSWARLLALAGKEDLVKASADALIDDVVGMGLTRSAMQLFPQVARLNRLPELEKRFRDRWKDDPGLEEFLREATAKWRGRRAREYRWSP